MPNCDYYATIEDHEKILDFIFSLGDEVDVYELNSKPEEPLQLFTTTEQVLHEFENTYETGQTWGTVYLNLHIKASNIPFEPRYIKLNPEHCDGKKYRYAADGYGMVQLYLSTQSNGALKDSHTNHFSQKRLEALTELSNTKERIEAVNFKAITNFSSKLNREIKKMAVAKIGGRILTKSALDLWDLGYKLTPFNKDNTVVIMLGD